MNATDDIHKVIVGGGALGLFLAWDLGQTTGTAPYVLSRSRVPSEAAIEVQGKRFHFSPPSWKTMDPEKLNLRNAKHTIFYLCIHPHQQHQALDAIASDEVAREIILKGQRSSFVFCNNGLVDSAVTDKVQVLFSGSRHLAFWRALVFAGFIREGTTEPITISHRGGRDVSFGTLAPTLPSEPVDEIPLMNFLHWKQTADILTLELQKFFVNYCIASAIGPRLLPNSAALEIWTRDKIQTAAQTFSNLWPEVQLEAEELITIFQRTAQSTGKNINSVSLSWYHGEAKPFEYFREALATRAKAMGKEDELKAGLWTTPPSR